MLWPGSPCRASEVCACSDFIPPLQTAVHSCIHAERCVRGHHPGFYKPFPGSAPGLLTALEKDDITLHERQMAFINPCMIVYGDEAESPCSWNLNGRFSLLFLVDSPIPHRIAPWLSRLFFVVLLSVPWKTDICFSSSLPKSLALRTTRFPHM